MFVYYESDGDSGWYNVRLFSTKENAEEYKQRIHSSYGGIHELEVDTEAKKPIVEDVLCPECNCKMISRKGQYGTFWGCSQYPKCRGTRDSMGRSKAERENSRSSENGETMSSSFERQAENDKFRFRKS